MTFGKRENNEVIKRKMAALVVAEPNISLKLERVLIDGDLSSLNVDERLDYVRKVAKAIGINAMLRPFDYIKFHNKTVLYANRACAEQLRMKYKISIKIVNREKTSDLYVVTAQAITGSGRTDEAIGAISIRGLTGEALANALLKCETKAKRRVTLSICGLGIMDEVEARDMAAREVKAVDQETIEVIQSKIETTDARPEFEKAEPESHPDEPTPAQKPEYILKAGKHIGKKISQLSKKQIAAWLSFYEKTYPTMSPNPDIESDYREILAFNDNQQLAQEEHDN